MKKSELRQIIKEEFDKVLDEIQDEYAKETLIQLQSLAKKQNLKLPTDYWEWFYNTKDFKDMIDTEKMNHRSPQQAAKSILSLWR